MKQEVQVVITLEVDATKSKDDIRQMILNPKLNLINEGLVKFEIKEEAELYNTNNPKLNSVWDFVERYYPNFTNSSEIALNIDYAKIVHGEIYGHALDLYASLAIEHNHTDFDYLSSIAQEKIDESNKDIYEKAIRGFLDEQNGNKKS